jgi:PST family polysaccharide transporter
VATSRSRDQLARGAVTGFLWAFLTFVSQKLLVFISTAVLARVLGASEIGVVAFALSIMAYMWRLTDIGMSEALVQRADAEEPKISSTVFWLSFANAAFLLVLTWVAAPYIARLGPSDPVVVDVIRVLALSFMLGPLSSVPRALLRHSLEYRKLVVPQVASGLSKGVLSIVLALAGAGVWSLVVGQIAGMVAAAVAIWFATTWRPRASISVPDIKSLARFGAGMTTLGLVAEGVVNVDYLIIGGKLGAAALGLYYFAFRLPDLIIGSVSQVSWEVLFPLYSRLRDTPEDSGPEDAALQRGYLKTMRLGALVIFPAGFGIAALSEPLIVATLGERWRPAATAMAFIALYSSFAAISGMSGTIFKALGKTFLMTRNSLLYLAILAPALWVAADHGITWVAAAHLVVQLIISVWLSIVVWRVLGVSPGAALNAILPGLVSSLVMAGLVLGISLSLPLAVALVVGPIAGATAFFVCVRLLFPRDLRLILDIVASLRARRSGGVAAPTTT